MEFREYLQFFKNARVPFGRWKLDSVRCIFAKVYNGVTKISDRHFIDLAMIIH